MQQLGITAEAGKFGIPATTVSWAKAGGGSNTLTVFSDIQKTPMNDLAIGNDNNGERQTSKDRNKRMQIRFSAYPKSTTEALAQAIAADLPFPNDLCTITAATDSQIDNQNNNTHSTVVDECSARWTPDNQLVVDFTITKWFDKKFEALS